MYANYSLFCDFITVRFSYPTGNNLAHSDYAECSNMVCMYVFIMCFFYVCMYVRRFRINLYFPLYALTMYVCRAFVTQTSARALAETTSTGQPAST